MSKSIEIVGNSYATATLAWLGYWAATALESPFLEGVFGFNAVLFTALSFLGLGVLAIMWIIRHVRITII